MKRSESFAVQAAAVAEEAKPEPVVEPVKKEEKKEEKAIEPLVLDIDEDPIEIEPVVKKPVAAPKAGGAAKTASSLSLAALLDDDEEPMIELVEEVSADGSVPALPSDELLMEKWAELAAEQNQPRLATALSSAKLEFSEADGMKTVKFFVANVAQKKWIEERCLRTLELNLKEKASCMKLRLITEVTPVEQQEQKIYMPQEQAMDLMNRNEEVKAFVADLGLDI